MPRRWLATHAAIVARRTTVHTQARSDCQRARRCQRRRSRGSSGAASAGSRGTRTPAADLRVSGRRWRGGELSDQGFDVTVVLLRLEDPEVPALELHACARAAVVDPGVAIDAFEDQRLHLR